MKRPLCHTQMNSFLGVSLDLMNTIHIPEMSCNNKYEEILGLWELKVKHKSLSPHNSAYVTTDCRLVSIQLGGKIKGKNAMYVHLDVHLAFS